MPETLAPEATERDEQQALLEARVDSARRAVEQAKTELAAAASERERTIWENRLAQRQSELDQLQKDRAPMEGDSTDE
ncbi:MAG: hypothetical protein HYY50_05245 [Candidatus Kerfeldbacteria bacterium]|nr:hypothetical protein [Candidatus Kerfeldbacteria bacterium]